MEKSRDDEIRRYTDELRRDNKTLDDRLQRYRERRRAYESMRSGGSRAKGYPAQRGIRRDYRV
jgi:hypothetical protein